MNSIKWSMKTTIDYLKMKERDGKCSEKKLDRENIQVSQLNNALKKAFKWRNAIAHPKQLRIELSQLDES